MQAEKRARMLAVLVKDGWVKGTNWIDDVLMALSGRRWRDDSAEVREEVGRSLAEPEAWRIIIEGPDTPGRSWNYPVLVIEFLYLGKVPDKVETSWLMGLFSACDSSAFTEFRALVVDEQGHKHPYVDGSFTPHPVNLGRQGKQEH